MIEAASGYGNADPGRAGSLLTILRARDLVCLSTDSGCLDVIYGLLFGNFPYLSRTLACILPAPILIQQEKDINGEKPNGVRMSPTRVVLLINPGVYTGALSIYQRKIRIRPGA
jgi:hypothetical protein